MFQNFTKASFRTVQAGSIRSIRLSSTAQASSGTSKKVGGVIVVSAAALAVTYYKFDSVVSVATSIMGAGSNTKNGKGKELPTAQMVVPPSPSPPSSSHHSTIGRHKSEREWTRRMSSNKKKK